MHNIGIRDCSRRRLRIILATAALSILVAQGCTELRDKLTKIGEEEEEVVAAMVRDAGPFGTLSLGRVLAKTYESFLANTETGTVGWGSERSYRRVKPLGPELNIIESNDQFVAFVINHRNEVDAKPGPSYLAVRLILAMDPKASEASAVTIIREGDWWDDEAKKWVEEKFEDQVNATPAEFAKAHEVSYAQPPYKKVQRWHAKVLPSEPSTWDIESSRKFWSEWEVLFPPSGDPEELRKDLDIHDEAKIFTKNFLLRFQETPAKSSRKPVWFYISRNLVRGLRLSTFSPTSPENYKRDVFLRFKAAT